VLACLLIASPAAADFLRIQWEGVATEVGYLTRDGEWVEEEIDSAVRGSIVLNLGQLDDDDFVPGLGYHWNSETGPDYDEWSFEIDDSTIPLMHFYDGDCFAECALRPVNGATDTLRLSGAEDPLAGLVLLVDPTGVLIGDDLGINSVSGLTGLWEMETLLQADPTLDGYLAGRITKAKVTVGPIPEPSSALVFSVGILVFGAAVRSSRTRC
jgi:hypothetical protein